MAEKDAEAARIDQQQLEEVDKAVHGIARALGGTTKEKFLETISGIQDYINRIKKQKEPPTESPQDKK